MAEIRHELTAKWPLATRNQPTPHKSDVMESQKGIAEELSEAGSADNNTLTHFCRGLTAPEALSSPCSIQYFDCPEGRLGLR